MLSDCARCWETPCSCGHEYQSWSTLELTEFIQMLQKVLDDKLQTHYNIKPDGKSK